MRWVTNSSWKDERGDEKGRSFFVGSAKGEPERTKCPREQGSHLGLILQGAEIRLFSWEEAAGAPGGGQIWVPRKAQERNGRWKHLFGSRRRRKALQGEAQERWILKEGCKGGKSKGSR
jgi:hypothetical protein